jgi:hypothetical protein
MVSTWVLAEACSVILVLVPLTSNLPIVCVDTPVIVKVELVLKISTSLEDDVALFGDQLVDVAKLPPLLPVQV